VGMTIVLDHENQVAALRATVDLRPVCEELSRRDDFARATLLVQDGLLILRLVRGDGAPYDTAIGLRTLQVVSPTPRRLALLVDVLLTTTLHRLRVRTLRAHGVLIGRDGALIQ